MRRTQKQPDEFLLDRTRIIPVRIEDDDILRQDNSLTRDEIRNVNVDVKKLLSTPVSSKDINQDGLGNCYLLAALGVILDKNPNYLKNLIKVNSEGLIEVKLYDTKNPAKAYLYILDPTVIIPKGGNNHKNDLIFLIEKAFAMHRMLTMKKPYKVEELEMMDKLVANEIALDLPVDKMLFEIKQKKLPYNNDEIIKFKKKYDKNFNTYISALTGGLVPYSFSSLLGTIPEPRIKIRRTDYNYIFNDFITNIIARKRLNLAIESPESKLLNFIFDNNEKLIQYFVEQIAKNWQINMSLEIISSLKSTKKMDYAAELATFFKKLLGDDNSDLNVEAQRLLNEFVRDYVDLNAKAKRGSGKYTNDQENLYNHLFKQLQKGKILTAETRSYVGVDPKKLRKNDQVLIKGLYTNHAYELVNCYERNGRKFCLLRNPHGTTIRNYQLKTESIFSASTGDQYKPISSSPISHAATSILNTDKLNAKAGYFEVELSDLSKRFEYVCSATLPEPLSVTIQKEMANLISYAEDISKEKENKLMIDLFSAKAQALRAQAAVYSQVAQNVECAIIACYQILDKPAAVQQLLARFNEGKDNHWTLNEVREQLEMVLEKSFPKLRTDDQQLKQ